MPKERFITIGSVKDHLTTWLAEKTDAAMAREAESLPLRQDMVTLLTFVRDARVVGTQATGNMPLKAVQEVTARFVNPPKLEETVGDQTFRIRSETDVWALYFLHILADVGGLLHAVRLQRWRLTVPGEQFLGLDVRLQIVFLLAVWWYRVNWIVAYPYAGMGDRLPLLFSRRTLAYLRSLPTRTSIPFEEFANRLIADTGLTWDAPEQSFAATSLRGAIHRMVIDILDDFGALVCKYRKESLGQRKVPKLVAFKITPWGMALLDALAVVGGGEKTWI